jgi:hypothetical protein
VLRIQDQIVTSFATLPLKQASPAPAVPDHPRTLRLWMGGQGFDVADGESGSVSESAWLSGSVGGRLSAVCRQADWQADTSRLPGHLPVDW